METVNAIAKVRFASARAQRVHLARNDTCLVEMLCMEPGQDVRLADGPWTYYVIKGTAKLAAGQASAELAAGQAAATGPAEAHTLANVGEGRLICLAIGASPGR